MEMTILVTGSSGLVGTQTTISLLDKGYKVVGFDLSQPSEKIMENDNFTFEKGDITDFPRLTEIVKQHVITAIIHGGGISHPQFATNAPNQIIQTNIVGTTNVYEIARIFEIKKIIYLSSGAVYGKNKADIVSESEVPTPSSVYGVTKLFGEQLAHVYMDLYDMEIISLRLGFVYGPNRVMHDPINFILTHAIKNKTINEPTGRNQELEYIYVKDVARAVMISLENTNLQETIFNIGTGINTSVTEIIKIAQNLYPESKVKFGEGDLGYDSRAPFDCTKAEEILGFKALYTIEHGIEEYAKSLESNIELQ